MTDLNPDRTSPPAKIAMAGNQPSEKKAGFVSVVFSIVAVAVVTGPPWAFGCIHPRFHWPLVILISTLASLWLWLLAFNRLIRRISWTHLAPLLLIAGLCALQVVALPDPVLRFLSPATSELHDSLLPATREVGVDGQQIEASSWAASQRVSVYPAETWKHTAWFCLLVLLFVATQTAFSKRMTRWLLTALVVNGALLSWIAILSLLQSDGTQVLTWKRDIWGESFGSFLNKNHFALYINMCLGAAIERWLSRYRDSNATGKPLQTDWQILLISTAIVTMLATLMISQSRGAVSSALVALAITAGIFGTRSTRKSRLVLGGVGVTVALAFAVWIYDDLHKSRIASFLFGGEILDVGRLQLWRRLAVLVPKFPVLGTGTGTIPFVEPLTRHEATPHIVRYAHNDYLQVLIENGFVVFAILLVFVWRVLRSHQSIGQSVSVSKSGRQQTRASSQPGIFFALVAVAFHGTVEFGLRMPGIAATVVMLSGCYVGNSMGRVRSKKRMLVLEARDKLPIFAFSFVTLFLSIQHFQRLATADREIARMERLDENDPAVLEHLNAAVDAWPFAVDSRLLLCEELCAKGDPDLLRDVQRHAVHARDLCPVFAYAQVDIARLAPTFQSADDASTYLRRAERLEASSPSLLFVAGHAKHLSGDVLGAIERWRLSIMLSPRHMNEIVETMVDGGYTEPQLASVIPDDADRLYAAAEASRKASDTSPLSSETLRDAWLARSHQQLVAISESVENSRLIHRRASIAAALGLVPQAIADFEIATTLMPNEESWRLQFARFLVEQRRNERAREELRLLVRMSESPAALRLLREISSHREIMSTP